MEKSNSAIFKRLKYIKKKAFSIISEKIGNARTRYYGEFGYELISVIPYAYWLYINKKLYKTEGTADTRCLYYFSPRHEEKNINRSFIQLREFPINNIHVTELDTSKWAPPPYKKVYQNKRFVWDKPSLIVSNKYSYEWGEPPANYLSIETLHKVFSLLKNKFQIIYNRPTKDDLPPDDQPILKFDDYQLIQRHFPEIITLSSLKKINNDLTFNTLQSMVYANSDYFISVQGGGCPLASYFGGTNIIYAKKGNELKVNAYQNWYNKLSGCKIMHTDNYENLISIITKEYL